MNPLFPVVLTTLQECPMDLVSVGLRFLSETPSTRESGAAGQQCEIPGGVLTDSMLATQLECSLLRAKALLGRWSGTRRVLLVGDSSKVLLPAYQIDVQRRAPRPSVEVILVELTGVYSNAEISDWFLTPNLRLAGRAPASLLEADPRAAIGAARADRFIACG